MLNHNLTLGYSKLDSEFPQNNTGRSNFADIKELPLKKRKIEVAVLSDIYLGNPNCHAEELTAYLSSIMPGILVLNGSLIDPSYADQDLLPAAHYKVLKRILNLASKGTRVCFIKGLHPSNEKSMPDLQLGKFEFGNQLTLALDGQKTWILHSSSISSFPRLSVTLLRMGSMGLLMCKLLKRLSKNPKKESQPLKDTTNPKVPSKKTFLQDRWQRAVGAKAIAENVQTVVCGSDSNPKKDWIETANGSCLYLNSGGWMAKQTALEYAFKRWKSYYYCEDKLSAFYADEELKGMDMNQLLSDLSGKIQKSGTPTTTASDD